MHYVLGDDVYLKKTDLERNELIYKLYFQYKLTLTQISHQINLSISQISRVLSKSPNYVQEKNKRKEENRKKHLEQTKEIIKNKRLQKQIEEKQILDILHNQASFELSYTHPMSKSAIRKHCSSAYNYNHNKKRFELKDDVAYSNDMPKIIKY